MGNDLKQESLIKYDEKIAFAKTRPDDEAPDSDLMEEIIGQDWYHDYCPYCEVYADNDCEDCPLRVGEYDSMKSTHCCGELWKEMSDARTWIEWIEYALLVRRHVRKHG